MLLSTTLSIVAIVVAIALFLRRMRRFATLFCLVGPIQVLTVFKGIGLTQLLSSCSPYWFGLILLHWPERRGRRAPRLWI
jgi:hypothetical protein